MLDHPFPALWFLCVSFCGVPACISSTFDVSLGCLCASSPYAGSPTSGSQVPPSEKPSAEGTTVCLSSDSVQCYDGKFWYFGTIQTWDATTVFVNKGAYGEVKAELAAVRQYSSAKQCSSIKPGTKSSLHSHPTDPPLARIKGSLFHLQPCVSPLCLLFEMTTHARNSARAGGGAPSTAGCIPVPPGQACSAREERERHVRGRCTVPSIRHVSRRQLVP
jgi:hypothetical protein